MRKTLLMVSALVAAPLLVVQIEPAGADVISPHVNGVGRVYSKEPPNAALYGTGISGRMLEASQLRYDGEQSLNSGSIDEAVRLLGKACQLDPGTPTGHLLYARAITAKFYATRGPVDEKLLSDCLYEWKMIWHHDADQLEQSEAKWQALKLGKIARALDKKKKEIARQMIAQSRGDGKRAGAEIEEEKSAETKIERLRDQGPSDAVDDLDSE